MSHFENSLAFAQEMDAKDPLKSFGERFHIPNFHHLVRINNMHYLD